MVTRAEPKAFDLAPVSHFRFTRTDTGNKLLVAVSARQVSAARWQDGRFAACDIFEYSVDGLSAFKDYLAQIRNLPVHMMVDAVEEDYRFELLPHSFGSERTEMVNRKLKQYYRNSPYCSARRQGRDSAKRRDERYLFCALTNPELITAWVQAVIERELPVAGIYLLSTASQGLIEKLQLRQTNLLVASINSSGLRLTFFRDQTLRISRLVSIDSTGAQATKSYAEEISNTRLYLHALRVMTLDEQLSALIVDSDDSLTELAGAIARDNPSIECRRLGRQEIIARLGISAPALDSSADALYLHLLGLRAPDSNLAPAEVTFGYRMHRARRGIYALAGITALAIAAWCAFTWYQIIDTNVDIKSDIETAAAQAAQLQAQYLETARRFPAPPASAENLQRAVEIAQKIGAFTRSPETMMTIVSQALDHNPAIKLKNFNWKYGRTEIEQQDPGKSAKTTSDPGPAGGARRQSALVEGEVRPFGGDYRAANESITRFAAALSQQPGVAEVRVINAPLNVSPSFTLSGDTKDSNAPPGKAEFKLLLVLKQTT